MTNVDILKQVRKESGMTQVQFCEYFKCPKRNLEDWEAGKRTIAPYLLRLICYKLYMENLVAEDLSDMVQEKVK